MGGLDTSLSLVSLGRSEVKQELYSRPELSSYVLQLYNCDLLCNSAQYSLHVSSLTSIDCSSREDQTSADTCENVTKQYICPAYPAGLTDIAGHSEARDTISLAA